MHPGGLIGFTTSEFGKIAVQHVLVLAEKIKRHLQRLMLKGMLIRLDLLLEVSHAARKACLNQIGLELCPLLSSRLHLRRSMSQRRHLCVLYIRLHNSIPPVERFPTE